MDARAPRDGRSLEDLGTYDPLESDPSASVTLKIDRILYWISVGAQPSEKVASILRAVGQRRVPPQSYEIYAASGLLAKCTIDPPVQLASLFRWKVSLTIGITEKVFENAAIENSSVLIQVSTASNDAEVSPAVKEVRVGSQAMSSPITFEVSGAAKSYRATFFIHRISERDNSFSRSHLMHSFSITNQRLSKATKRLQDMRRHTRPVAVVKEATPEDTQEQREVCHSP